MEEDIIEFSYGGGTEQRHSSVQYIEEVNGCMGSASSPSPWRMERKLWLQVICKTQNHADRIFTSPNN
jgi:hypothetical protein